MSRAIVRRVYAVDEASQLPFLVHCGDCGLNASEYNSGLGIPDSALQIRLGWKGRPRLTEFRWRGNAICGTVALSCSDARFRPMSMPDITHAAHGISLRDDVWADISQFLQMCASSVRILSRWGHPDFQAIKTRNIDKPELDSDDSHRIGAAIRLATFDTDHHQKRENVLFLGQIPSSG
ncbi:hypothetical protein DFH09DRAFT_1070553 [Mycena vulgaris]|nr:hypothetical protein DFH09DRAFT_1070553 [Mycena vulgaris]